MIPSSTKVFVADRISFYASSRLRLHELNISKNEIQMHSGIIRQTVKPSSSSRATFDVVAIVRYGYSATAK